MKKVTLVIALMIVISGWLTGPALSQKNLINFLTLPYTGIELAVVGITKFDPEKRVKEHFRKDVMDWVRAASDGINTGRFDVATPWAATSIGMNNGNSQLILVFAQDTGASVFMGRENIDFKKVFVDKPLLTPIASSGVLAYTLMIEKALQEKDVDLSFYKLALIDEETTMNNFRRGRIDFMCISGEKVPDAKKMGAEIIGTFPEATTSGIHISNRITDEKKQYILQMMVGAMKWIMQNKHNDELIKIMHEWSIRHGATEFSNLFTKENYYSYQRKLHIFSSTEELEKYNSKGLIKVYNEAKKHYRRKGKTLFPYEKMIDTTDFVRMMKE